MEAPSAHTSGVTRTSIAIQWLVRAKAGKPLEFEGARKQHRVLLLFRLPPCLFRLIRTWPPTTLSPTRKLSKADAPWLRSATRVSDARLLEAMPWIRHRGSPRQQHGLGHSVSFRAALPCPARAHRGSAVSSSWEGSGAWEARAWQATIVCRLGGCMRQLDPQTVVRKRLNCTLRITQRDAPCTA